MHSTCIDHNSAVSRQHLQYGYSSRVGHKRHSTWHSSHRSYPTPQIVGICTTIVWGHTRTHTHSHNFYTNLRNDTSLFDNSHGKTHGNCKTPLVYHGIPHGTPWCSCIGFAGSCTGPYGHGHRHACWHGPAISVAMARSAH